MMTFLVGTVFAFIIAGTAYQLEHQHETEDLEKRAHRLTDRLSLVFGLILEKQDFVSAQKIVEKTASDPGIAYMALINDQFKIVASSQKHLNTSLVSADTENPGLSEILTEMFKNKKEKTLRHLNNDLIDIIVPIETSSQPPPGYAMIISFRSRYISAESKNLFWSYLKLTLALTSVAMIILYFLLHRIVTFPLRQLISASRRLGQGDLGFQVPITSSYEIKTLTETFNQMSISLEAQQKAIKTSEGKYLHIFHFFPAPLILIDPAARIINVNSVYLSQSKSRIYLKEWEGKFVWDIPFVQKGDFKTDIHHLLEEGKPFKLWKVPITLSEKRPPSIFNISGIPLFENPGNISGAVLAIEDITLQQNLESQLIQSQKMESLEILTGGIAHDFNNILTAILGYTQLLLEQRPHDEFIQKALKVIEKSSLRARDLIQQMIGFARWHPLAKSRVDVVSLISETVSSVQKNLEADITLHYEPNHHSIYIFADEDQIHQALLNLCINARDAIETLPGHTGYIRLRTELTAPGAREYVYIHIQDNGTGMEPEVLSHIFEPFYTTKEVGKGSGLGLSVTYGIVKANDGDITVASEPGKGTTFILRFPTIA
ncbi:MAG: HAMP domain-containing protein [Nitrospirae bacterium]|nr:HAMP domain-containing protein [Nitrospirota bacterium]MBI3351878.1 HAMP domain-containing protein [Nitrospirota bacterium]